jgi:hypothetical protein
VTKEGVLQLAKKLNPLMEKENTKYICAILVGIRVVYSLYKFFHGARYL